MLAGWKLSGWPAAFDRIPQPDDLIVPHAKPTNRGPRVEFGGMRADHDSYKRFLLDLDGLGMRKRRVHDLRRTAITLYPGCRGGQGHSAPLHAPARSRRA